MDKVKLGTLELSRLGLGTRTLRADGADEVIGRAQELGITYLDTAGHYGGGAAQDLVGRAIRGRRTALQVGIHVGTPGDDGRTTLCPSRIRAEVDEALSRLGTDYVDLLNLHYPDPGADYGEVAVVIEDLRARGVVREYGVSNFDRRELLRWPGWSRPVSVQLPYNLFQRQRVDEARDVLRERGIQVIAYTPLLAGVLTAGGVAGEPGGGLAGVIYGRLDDGGRQLLQQLGEAAEAAGLSPAGLAAAWALSDPDVALAVVGAGRVGHLDQVWEAVGSLDRLWPVITELGRTTPAEPVLPMAGVVVAVVQDDGREALAEVRFDVGEGGVTVRRWLPRGVQAGDRLRWDGLSDRLVEIL